jgi:uncharacterized protein with von Willebrand factor type A (vWA) domain
MSDSRSLTRLLDELVWTLRRQGFTIAPSQVLDLLRAVRALGWDDPLALREATAAIFLQRATDRPRFDVAFTAFFARSGPSLDLWERLRAQGFTQEEVLALRELLDAMGQTMGGGEAVPRLGALLEGRFELDRLLQLAGVRHDLDALRNPLQLGFFTQRIAERIGLRAARSRLAELRPYLRDALGARGDALADALAHELDRTGETLREHLRAATLRKGDDEDSKTKKKREELPFTSLHDSDLEEVRRAVRGFGERLRGAARVRARRARRGRIDPGRTLRAMTRTGGVPFKPVRRQRRRDKPRLILLCDVSDSVRTASRFMLELVYAAHELFDRTRSFVFVSELGETTTLFEKEPVRTALAVAYSGEVVSVTDNSNYGRVLRAFEARHLPVIDRRTTVVILGDGRTNYHDAAEDTLGRIRARARALYWFCSEPRAAWLTGDSAMPRYAPKCTKVFEVSTARELEDATRALVWVR